MNGLSAKYKIVIVLVIFLLIATGMFLFGYGILDNKNRAAAEIVGKKNTEYEDVVREQRSFEQGKKDLATLTAKPHPPGDLFSKDTKLVKEIQTLEALAEEHGLKLTLQISGTAKSGIKVPKVSGELYAIPYTVTVEGAYDDFMKYMQSIEHLDFVTHTKSVTISALKAGVVRGTLGAEFYIKK